jgi:hypothetical protein
VTALAAGATAAQALQVTSWKNTAITVILPATFTGLSIIGVSAVAGNDAMAIMAALPNPSIISGSPASLQFGYIVGGTAPASQSVQITNSGVERSAGLPRQTRLG